MYKKIMLGAALMLAACTAFAQVAEEPVDPVLAHSHETTAPDTIVFLLRETGECPGGTSAAGKMTGDELVDFGCWAFNEETKEVMLFWMKAQEFEYISESTFYEGSAADHE